MAELSRVTEEIVHERAKALGSSILMDSSVREAHFMACYIKNLKEQAYRLNRQYNPENVMEAFRCEMGPEKFSMYFIDN